MRFDLFIIRFGVLLTVLAAGKSLFACPFCNAESQTLSEETRGADAVVLAKLVKEAPAAANPADPTSGTATFQILEVLHGQELVKGAKQIGVVFFGDTNRERTYLVNGIGKDKIDWTTPLPLSPAAVQYVKQLANVAPGGAERLVFFQDYLENDDPLLAQDAYDEFARAPYTELRELGARMKHDRIVKWVTDPETSPNRRRLYLTMLGICGSKDDVPMLESMIASDFEATKPALEQLVRTGLLMGGPIGLPAWLDTVEQEERRKKLGLDALVACYLILRGPDGLELVENRFLKNPRAEYTHIYSVIMALRFHGDENTGILPRERLLASMRLLLDNQDFNDQVILDLSRWEDWSVLDRLVDMFKKSDQKGVIRQPVVSYLTVASEQPGDVGTRAKSAMAELEKLDPETVKAARALMAFGALGRARGVASAAGAAAAKPQAGGDGGLSAASATDTKQGFAASPADEKTDSKTIPDPESFGQKDSQAAGGNGAKAGQAAAPAAVRPISLQAEAAQPRVIRPVVAGHMNPFVVTGVPLGAAVLLMGVYWLILRAARCDEQTMSSATIDREFVSSEEEPLQYRALHTGALIGLVLGVLSIFVAITAADSFEGCLLVTPIPMTGIAVSLWSLTKIRQSPDQYIGKALAKAGLVLSIVFLIGGVGYGKYKSVTEVPDGYTPISFATMKPDELQERGGVTVPPDITTLEGKKIFIKGYIRPDSVTVPRGIDRFLLVRDNNTCCFGDLSKIKYHDQILVTMVGDRRVDYSQGVFRIGGVLHIEPQYARPGAPRPVFSLKADYSN